MQKKFLGAFSFSVLGAFLLAAASCGGNGDAESNPFGLRSTTVARAENAVALTFAPDGRLFFAEKYTGNIRIVDANGTLLPQPFAHIDVANWLNLDWGLTGLALHPQFETNHYVYAFYTAPLEPSATSPLARPALMRFTDQDSVGVEPVVLLNDFPGTRADHQGFKANGPMSFGPDGALYMSVGDYDWNMDGPNGAPAALDLTFPGGKILRVNEVGQALPENPQFAQGGAAARIWAIGFNHESPFDFHPSTGGLYSTDTTGSCEELNIITSNGDYGWPLVGEFPFSDCYYGTQVKAIHLFAREGFSPGDFQSGPGISGLKFLHNSTYPTLTDGLLVCESETGIMRRLVLEGANFDRVASNDIVTRDCSGDVAVAPDGTIFYSNRLEIKRLDPDPASERPSP